MAYGLLTMLVAWLLLSMVLAFTDTGGTNYAE